ncbi:MAG TPA: hypothetical protein VFI45_02430, partial [Candidatus Acidoferrum sp.]|nr:hypothetical protein [Candidatus Acidoferrum sp.]
MDNHLPVFVGLRLLELGDVAAQTINNESRAISELYNYASRNPALSVLGLAAELSHKPICLHQAYSDPLPKPDVQSSANEHGEGVVAGPSRRDCRATKQGMHEGLN